MDKRTYFGIKSIKGFYDVKEIRIPEEIENKVSEFDFILQDTQFEDFVSASNNIYVHGKVEVMTDFYDGDNNAVMMNGWRLLYFSKWGGDYFIGLQDRFGKEKKIKTNGPVNIDYKIEKNIYIHDSLNIARDFTKKYISIEHYAFVNAKFDEFSNPNCERTPSQIEYIIIRIHEFTNTYLTIYSFLKKESAPQKMIDELNSLYDNKINRFFRFGIKFDE